MSQLYAGYKFRPCPHKAIFKHFRNCENHNDINYKNSHCMKCLVFVQRPSSCWFQSWFSLNYCMSTNLELFEMIQNDNARKQHHVHIALVV